MYVAKKRIFVKNEKGKYEYRLPGEYVPEAENWKNIEFWLDDGAIAFVKDVPIKKEPEKIARIDEDPVEKKFKRKNFKKKKKL